MQVDDAPGIRCSDCDSKCLKNVYVIINRVSGSVFGWIEDPDDFESLKIKISKTYGIRPELLSYYKLDYIGE
jgi:hypothetical protein